MSGNPYYGAWFVYTLKLSEYFSKNNIPVAVMYNKNFHPTANLVKYILKIISEDNSVLHPAYIHQTFPYYGIFWKSILMYYQTT